MKIQIPEQLLKRIKSFLWRLGGYLLAAALVWISEHLGELQLPTYITAILTLLIGELTKYLNTGRVVKVKS